ncbi:MAG TPA: hypothetical protein VE820_01400, partial [Sphingomicrobium sp.]|nr:hypothetical protein [Sphingomicrobium sp.]
SARSAKLPMKFGLHRGNLREGALDRRSNLSCSAAFDCRRDDGQFTSELQMSRLSLIGSL